MEFRVVYQGPLPASGPRNRRTVEKHGIRRTIHPQLKMLWDQPPLNACSQYLREDPPNPGDYALIRRIGDHNYAPVVSSEMSLFSELDIVFLRPRMPGDIVHGGDVDNRIKTLLDALRFPGGHQEILQGFVPTADEHPLFCLLDDDRIVTKLAVTVDRLLKPVEAGHVELIIHVRTRGWKVTNGNLGLLS